MLVYSRYGRDLLVLVEHATAMHCSLGVYKTPIRMESLTFVGQRPRYTFFNLCF